MTTEKWKIWEQRKGLVIVAFLFLSQIVLTPASSFAFSLYDAKGIKANLDTTLTYGLMFRVADRDDDQIGAGNGGTGDNPNWDDGDLNYDKGIVSNQVRITSELDVSTDNFGAFVRGSAFFDYENMEEDRERTDLGNHAEDQVGSDIELLDAYVWGSTDLGPFPIQLRLGEQVVNWGESTFILGGLGLNTLNSINIGKLRSPGAELREALTPEGMVYGSIGLSENLSMEGLYLYDWEETKLDEPGTYFGAIDFAGEDGLKYVIANVADNGNAPAALTFMGVPRSSDVDADSQGQFGVALRYFAPWLHDTELSLFYMRYHNKMPILNVQTGTQQGAVDGVAAAGQVYADAGVNPGDDPAVDALAQAMAVDTYMHTAHYRFDYAEDIDLIGAGFNTELFGWGFQGEISHRQDIPLQIDDT